VEGWTDTHLLLSSEQMEQLNQLAERARSLPSARRGDGVRSAERAYRAESHVAQLLR